MLLLLLLLFAAAVVVNVVVVVVVVVVVFFMTRRRGVRIIKNNPSKKIFSPYILYFQTKPNNIPFSIFRAAAAVQPCLSLIAHHIDPLPSSPRTFDIYLSYLIPYI